MTNYRSSHDRRRSREATSFMTCFCDAFWCASVSMTRSLLLAGWLALVNLSTSLFRSVCSLSAGCAGRQLWMREGGRDRRPQ